jgi:hypothetical protein
MRRISLALAAIVAALLVGCGGAPRSDHAARSAGTLYLEGLTKYDKLVALDLQTGRTRKLPVWGCGCDATFCLVPSGGKLVIGGVSNTHVYDPTAPAGQRDRRIGNGWVIVPSPTPGAVWLGIRDHRKRKRSTWPSLKMRSVREMTVDGRVVQSVHVPGDAWPGGSGAFPVGAVREGLVFRTQHGLVVWRPRAVDAIARVPGFDGLARLIQRLSPGTVEEKVRVPGRFPEVADTHGDRIAWCAGDCHRFRVTNARSGETIAVRPPAGYRFQPNEDGTFSPDGSLLALPVVPTRDLRPTGDARDGARWSMAIVNASGGAAQAVKGSRLGRYHAMAWSASGGRLFFDSGNGTIMAYRPGAPRATLLARVHGTILHMAAL